MKEQFEQELQELYDYLENQKTTINQLYSYLENNQLDKLTIIDDFAKHLEIDTLSNDITLALITRLVNLRDDSLVQVLKKLDKTEDEIIELQEKAYSFVKDYWHNIHKNTVDFIKQNNLLSPFYQTVFEGVYNIGLAMSAWQTSWTKLIINTVNKQLLKINDNDEKKVFEYLEKNSLYDLGHNGEIADRCYSVLIQNKDQFESQAYIKAFKKEVTKVIDELEDFADKLIELEDNIYNQKWEYILYIQSLVKAFSNDNTNTLVESWAKVDEAWMSITTPIQIGHPLEYYEDHFRKAVALEWDIRVSNPKAVNSNQRANKLENMFNNIYSEIEPNNNYDKIVDFSKKSLKKVQLYLGRPALFFGAELNGLFSAQVVPNDEIVSKQYGKKIFAFSDEILQAQRAKPFLKLTREFLGEEFLKKDREFLFKQTTKWHQVYDITTIGHEYGHILWCDDTTEAVMNSTGNFKNIEEFKATTGGLVSFYIDEDPNESDLWQDVLRDTIKRAIGLIGWMEVDEVQPYYCEGLIHLSGLFDSKILKWENNHLYIDISKDNYEALKQWYIQTYKSLAIHYLDKEDATIWLNQFAIKDDKYFMPINKNIYNFVLHYFDRYKKIGQELDDIDKKSNYI
jgi:hypothetical protein